MHAFNRPTLTLLTVAALAVSLMGCSAAVRNSLSKNSDTQCRSIERQGSKMHDTVCLTIEEWAVIDAEAAEQNAATSDTLRRTDDINAQMPVSPGSAYDPYSRGGY